MTAHPFVILSRWTVLGQRSTRSGLAHSAMRAHQGVTCRMSRLERPAALQSGQPAGRQGHARRRAGAGAPRPARGADLLADPSVVGALASAEPAGVADRRAWCRAGVRASCCATTTTVLLERARRDSLPRRLQRRVVSGRRHRRLGGGRATSCSPASMCRARRSASSSSTTAARPASRPTNLTALMRERRRHRGARQPPVRRIFARLDPDRNQRAGRRAGAARARHGAVARHTVVVNCAGRTRSIIGAQSLINAGVPNKVVALRNGTMGWTLAGLTCDSGKDQRAPPPRAEGLGLGANRPPPRWRAAMASPHRCALTLARFRAEQDARTLYRLRRARPGRIRGRSRRRRGVGAGRTTGAGDRPVCRHARRPHRAGG